jgi:hypothetical protein
VVVLVGAVTGFLGLGLGIAVGAALFSPNVGRLFRRSVGWAFGAAGIATAIGVIVSLLLPPTSIIGSVVFLASGVLLAAAVPVVVEWRRLAEAPPGPEASLTLASF